MAIDAATITNGIKIFRNISEDEVANAIQVATLQATADQINDKSAKNSAVICYARHLLYLQWFDSQGGVTAANAFGNSNTISNPHMNDDGWLTQYNSIAKGYGQSSNSGMIRTYGS